MYKRQRLGALVDCLEAAQRAYGVPVLVSTHPRTRKRLDALIADTGRVLPESITWHKPLGFIDYVRLQQEALCVLLSLIHI